LSAQSLLEAGSHFKGLRNLTIVRLWLPHSISDVGQIQGVSKRTCPRGLHIGIKQNNDVQTGGISHINEVFCTILISTIGHGTENSIIDHRRTRSNYFNGGLVAIGNILNQAHN